ncbi:MAG: T9SS type A sorting domain-containing protein [candidate division Zixibacteria bacterium]|nr:T9SS type A sorting domain-containing protein [candidate division Zixibacteria bacterium]
MKQNIKISLLVTIAVFLMNSPVFSQPEVGNITGVVAEQDTGEPLVRSVVMAFHIEGHHRPADMAWTDTLGNYELTVPYGDYHVQSHQRQYYPEWWEEVDNREEATTVTVDADNSPDGINFTLGAITFGGIAGVITDASTGEPIVRASVVAIGTEHPRHHRWGFTNDAGEYEIELVSGTYDIKVHAHDYQPAMSEEPIVVEDEIIAGVDFALDALVFGSISGTVYDDSTGEVIQRAHINARMIDGWYRGGARTDSLGDYTMGRLIPGDYVLTAHSRGYMHAVYPETIAVEGDMNIPDIDFYLSPYGSEFDGFISGTVIDEGTSEPIADAFLAVIGFDGEHRHRVRFTFSGDDGTYMFERLPSWEHKVFCAARGYIREFYDNKETWEDADIITPDAENIDFALAVREPGPRFIGGQVNENGESLAGALVFAEQDGELKYAAITYPDGSYDFEGVDAAVYSIRVISTTLEEGILDEVSVLYTDVYDADVVFNPTLVDDDVIVPLQTALRGNYPNPFNANTNISFDLAQAGKVNLSVYNLMGQELEILVNENLQAGSHSISWNASNYSSGIYFYKLLTGEQTSTKRMTLLK